MKKAFAAFAVLSLVFNLGCTLQKPVDDVNVVQAQYDELVRPIVRIKGGVELPDGRKAQWTGSGVIVYSNPNETNSGFDTYILTCNHVVEVPIFDPAQNVPSGPFGSPLKINGFKYGVDYVEIFNPDGTSRKVGGIVVLQSNNNIFEANKDGDLVVKTEGGVDEETGLPAGEDLALVRLNTAEKLPAAKMMPRSGIEKLRLFFKARVVGCSLGGRPYHTFGEITVLENGYMSVNAQFVPGNSGGAAYLDATHEFIGITNAGLNPVWHMGLIRPLQRIYDWMDKGGYTFIYDKLFPVESKLQTLRLDRDRPSIEANTTINELRSQVNKLNYKVTLIIEELNKIIINTTTQHKVDQEEVSGIKKSIENINEAILAILKDLALLSPKTARV